MENECVRPENVIYQEQIHLILFNIIQLIFKGQWTLLWWIQAVTLTAGTDVGRSSTWPQEPQAGCQEEGNRIKAESVRRGRRRCGAYGTIKRRISWKNQILQISFFKKAHFWKALDVLMRYEVLMRNVNAVKHFLSVPFSPPSIRPEKTARFQLIVSVMSRSNPSHISIYSAYSSVAFIYSGKTLIFQKNTSKIHTISSDFMQLMCLLNQYQWTV